MANALWHRINAGAITRKHLQRALEVSPGTIDNLLNGRSDPSGRVLDGLIALLKASFVNDVWGHHALYCLDRRDEKRAELLRRRDEIEAELQRMGV